MLILAAELDDGFWTALGAVGAVLAVPAMIGVGWLGYRAVWPRRKVRWSARIRPLMSHEAGHTSRLTMEFEGSQLRRPHFVEIELSNVGNKDLEPAHFNGLPVDIRSSVPVVALLGHGSDPSVQRVFRPTHADPHLVSLETTTPLHKGQTMAYVMLVDGFEPKVELRASVSNAKVEERVPGTHFMRAAPDRLLTAAAISATVSTVVALIAPFMEH